ARVVPAGGAALGSEPGRDARRASKVAIALRSAARQLRDVAGEADYAGRYHNPVFSSYPCIRLKFCTATPLAPRTRLSSATKTRILPRTTRTDTSMKLELAVSLVAGRWLTTRTNGA